MLFCMAGKDDKKNKQEEEIKEFCQRRSLLKAKQVAVFLEEVALNDAYRDTKSVKKRDPVTEQISMEEISVPVPVNVRVTAAKVWKEMIMDKAIGDIKEKAKSTRSEGVDMKKAMEAIAKAKAAEKAEPSEEIL